MIWKNIIRIALDLSFFTFSYLAAFILRFDCSIPPAYFSAMMFQSLPLALVLESFFFWYFGLFRGTWRYSSITDLFSIIKAASLSTITLLALIYLSRSFYGYPRSIFFINGALLILSSGGIRFSRRILWEELAGKIKGARRVLIVGAGDTGESILREMKKNGFYCPAAIIDDDPKKLGKEIHGIRVVGSRAMIPNIVKEKRVEEIIIAIPRAKAEEMRDIVRYCRESKVPFKTIPPIRETLQGKSYLSLVREVKIEDLIGRQPVKFQLDRVRGEIQAKRVLITGAGGSIGWELSRQVADLMPEKLILLDQAENSLFYLERELRKDFPSQILVPFVGNVADNALMNFMLRNHLPQLVLHAAAYKHVPMMELNPWESIKNNLLGTVSIASACQRHGVDKFIFISTDKAANPVSFMGTSKRISELYIQGLAKVNHSKFFSVRFGNVLESTGSVVKIFKEQIEKERTVTVTHPEACRYFMSKTEAVHLVLEASALGRGGEIFVLNMGEPVKILDLAKELIILAGLHPEKDVEIVFTGLRPGEKLVEDLYNSGEEILSTSHDKIHRVNSPYHDWVKLNEDIKELDALAMEMDVQGLKEKLKQMIA